jgi:hypothetical protein
MNTSYSVRFKREQVLTDCLSWAELDYTNGASTDATAELTFHVMQAGTAHGLCVWFETQLFDEIGYSTGPGAMNSIYGHTFFPWLDAVPVEQGQEIQVRLQANLVRSDYVWRWETRLSTNGSGAPRHFRQCTFEGAQLSSASLRRRAADFVPSLSAEGRADRWLLQTMDGKTSLQQMAQEAARQFPEIFPRWEDALRRAADLAAQFSR